MRNIVAATVVVCVFVLGAPLHTAQAWFIEHGPVGPFDECITWGGYDWYTTMCYGFGGVYQGQVFSGNYFH